MSQLDLFGRAVAPTPQVPNPNDIRRRMEGVLTELMSADRMPWPERKQLEWQTIWPQMMRWLPEAERPDLVRRFEEQFARLT